MRLKEFPNGVNLDTGGEPFSVASDRHGQRAL